MGNNTMGDSPRITFSTCWYQFKAKFNHDVYRQWIANMLSNVRNYNLVVYTDTASCTDAGLVAMVGDNPRIRIVLKPMEAWHNYTMRDVWEANHARNELLAGLVDWRVNMLWSEKVHFVAESVARGYFDTEFHGWCDIGYFRNRGTGPAGCQDTPMGMLREWPNPAKIADLDPSKVHYGCVTNDLGVIETCKGCIASGQPMDPRVNLVAGGFFVMYKDKAAWWASTYDAKLHQYFAQGRVVKDDQQIIADCVLSADTAPHFCMHREAGASHDVWFMFQRLLL
jgi:hypothetical protein